MWRCWISPNDNSALAHGLPRSGLRSAGVLKGEARVSIRPAVRPPGKDQYRTGQVQEYDLARFAARSSTSTKSLSRLLGQVNYATTGSTPEAVDPDSLWTIRDAIRLPCDVSQSSASLITRWLALIPGVRKHQMRGTVLAFVSNSY
jgi:hypothetical protein